KLSYFPKSLWQRFTRNFEEIELLQVKIKLREQLRARWQESGEELFKRVADSSHVVVFVLDEFPMMIDRMARSEAHREEAKTLLRWLGSLRLAPNIRNVRFMIAGSIGIGRVLNELGEIATINDFEQVHLDPFPLKIANEFLDVLANTHQLTLSQPSKRKII